VINHQSSVISQSRQSSVNHQFIFYQSIGASSDSKPGRPWTTEARLPNDRWQITEDWLLLLIDDWWPDA
jgi:S-methylmethionine-dependent homocysteine/selenocysteine methylase